MDKTLACQNKNGKNQILLECIIGLEAGKTDQGVSPTQDRWEQVQNQTNALGCTEVFQCIPIREKRKTGQEEKTVNLHPFLITTCNDKYLIQHDSKYV